MAKSLPVPQILLLAGLSATALVTWHFASTARATDALRFENVAADIEGRFTNRMGRHITALLGGAGLFAAGDGLTGNEFGAYVERLQSFGGLGGAQGIGFSRRVLAAGKAALISGMRGAGQPDFHIWPDGERGEYHSIVYLEPATRRNVQAFGFDMHTEGVRREAMDRARDTGKPAATGRVTLIQELTTNDPQAGFLVYVPVYRGAAVPPTLEGRQRALTGFVYSPFRTGDLLSDLLSPAERGSVRMALFDGTIADPEHRLYESVSPPSSPSLSLERRLNLAGRPLTMTFQSLPSFPLSSQSDAGVLGCLLGVAVTLLLFGLAQVQARARLAAEGNAARLREAREEALRSLRTRDSFLSVASHELKTPLTAMQLHVDGVLRVLERAGEPMDDVWRAKMTQRLSSVARQSRRLATLVNEMLDVTRISSGRLILQPEAFDLADLIEELRGRFEPELIRAGCPLELDVPPATSGEWDRMRLDQVLTNLLSNALKYGAGHPIAISAHVDESTLRLYVQDHGMGIDAKDHVRIFERFQRAVPERKFGGFGIGLWISREIVLAMGGQIAVHSRRGEGAIFIVTLPRHPLPMGPPVRTPS